MVAVGLAVSQQLMSLLAQQPVVVQRLDEMKL